MHVHLLLTAIEFVACFVDHIQMCVLLDWLVHAHLEKLANQSIIIIVINFLLCINS